jgi:hypothetical protein
LAVLAAIPPLLTDPLEVFREVQDVSYDVRDLHTEPAALNTGCTSAATAIECTHLRPRAANANG